LGLFVAAADAPWAALELRSKRANHVKTVSCGRKVGRAASIELDIGRDTAATLQVPRSSSPPAEAVDALTEALGRELHRWQLLAESALLRGAVQATSSALLLFGSSGEILFANPPADRLLSRQTEDELMVECDDGSQSPLFELICSRVGQMLDGTRRHPWRARLPLSDGAELTSEVVPLESGLEGLGRVVLAILRDIRLPPDRLVDDFASQHNLSPREREVLGLLIQGHDTAGLADRLGISPHTVRDHLKNVFRKTANRSRSELLSALAGAGGHNRCVDEP
jgi:DNA-binding CsgD family transcriptional regulator/PAS domain-containing protein